MTKALIKYLIALCMLGLTDGLLSAHIHRERTSYSSDDLRFTSPTRFNNEDCEQHNRIPSFSSASFSGSGAINFIIGIAETEVEEETISSKKNLESSYVDSVLLAQTLGHFFTHDKKALSFYSCYPNISSDRYLIFEVFRI